MVCTGPINYVGMAAVQTDIENVNTALQNVQPQEAFIPAASPGILAQGGRIRNEYYPTTDGFLEALAQAMRQEYQASVQGKSGRARSTGTLTRRILSFLGSALTFWPPTIAMRLRCNVPWCVINRGMPA
jgi:hypothetical protein